MLSPNKLGKEYRASLPPRIPRDSANAASVSRSHELLRSASAHRRQCSDGDLCVPSPSGTPDPPPLLWGAHQASRCDGTTVSSLQAGVGYGTGVVEDDRRRSMDDLPQELQIEGEILPSEHDAPCSTLAPG
jgi:hypothetical protein